MVFFQNRRDGGFSKILLAGAALALSISSLAGAAGTDAVGLANGDRLTGDVKRMERGRLRFKTDALDRILIKWGHVVELASESIYEVEIDSGSKHLGSIRTADTEDHQLIVSGANGSVTLPFASIVRITPIKDSFWKRMDGSLSLGFSFAKADAATQYSLELSSSHRSRNWLRGLNVNSNQSGKNGAEGSSRSSASFNLTRFLAGRRLVLAFGQLQNNEELALKFRALAGAGYGRFLKRTPHTELALLGGLAVNQENFGDPAGPHSNLEALGTLTLSFFTFDTPQTQVDLGFFIYPGLTASDRLRTELDITLRRELFEDFFLDLSFRNSTDSRPPLDGAEGDDWWLVSGLSWTW